MVLQGHLAQELGRGMEDEFTALIEGLGYQVLRIRNPCPSIDLVADFLGKPILERGKQTLPSIRLLRPPFSPEGLTAFSIKRGEFNLRDAEDLLQAVEQAKVSDDKLLTALRGSIIVTNHTVTEYRLNKLRNRGVYCWDVRRLIFYAAKARTIRELAPVNALLEQIQPSGTRGSHLVQIESMPEKGKFRVNAVVFIDDHDLMLHYDHTLGILNNLYGTSIEPICRSTGFSVHATVTIHVLGLAQRQLVNKAYEDYASDQSAHPNVTFSAEPGLRVFQYGEAPWAPFLRL